MTSLRDLTIHDLSHSHSNRYESSPATMPETYAIDSETYEGYGRLFCDSYGRSLFVGEDEPEEILDWLHYGRYRGKTGFAWNIDFEVRAILKHFPSWVIYNLYYFGDVEYGEWKLSWIPDKYFAVSKDGQKTKIFDVQQFYYMGLDKAAQKILGESKDDVSYDDLGRWDYWETHRSEIREYCIRDAELTDELGRIMAQTFTERGVPFDRPYSTGYISGRYFITETDMPVINKCPWHTYAMKGYYAGRFEVVRRGYFPEAYYYDINSCFPYHMADLPDFTRGEWVKDDEIPSESEVGFGKCRTWVDCDTVSPIAKNIEGVNKYPNTDGVVSYLEQREIEYIRDMDDARLEIEDGFWFLPTDDRKPFDMIYDLYDQRNQLKAEMAEAEESGDSELEARRFVQQQAVKILMNSIYGKTVEVKEDYVPTNDAREATISVDSPKHDHDMFKPEHRPGQLFFPMIGSTITARARVQLYDAMQKAGDNLIAGFADCIVVDEPIIDTEDGLGGWDLDAKGELLMVQSGIYTFRKPDGKVKTAWRGFSFDNDTDLIEIFENNPEATKLSRPDSERPVTIGDTLIDPGENAMEKLNTFKEMDRALSIENDEKRRWNREPEKCHDLLNSRIGSKPIDHA